MKKTSKKKLKKLDKLPLLEIRYQPTKLTKKPLDKRKKVAKYLRKLYDKNTFWEREEVIVLAFQNEHFPIGYFSIAKGDFSEVKYSNPQILRRLLASGATGFIISHNHPHDIPYPSNADLKSANALGLLAKQLELEMYDEIIITKNDYFSFEKQGMLYE